MSLNVTDSSWRGGRACGREPEMKCSKSYSREKMCTCKNEEFFLPKRESWRMFSQESKMHEKYKIAHRAAEIIQDRNPSGGRGGQRE